MTGFSCPSCRAKLHHTDNLTTDKIRCPYCGRLVVIHDSLSTPKFHSRHSKTKKISFVHHQDKYQFSLRQNFENDMRDQAVFLKEMLMVYWRTNPVGLSAHIFYESLESINEETPPKQIATIVSNAIKSIELENPDVFRLEFSQMIGELCSQMIQAPITETAKIYPQTMKFMASHCNFDSASISKDFSRMVSNAIAKQNVHYTSIYKYYCQLVEFQPRYKKIMSRFGIMDFMLGFSAGYIGGELGSFGADLWQDWRHSSDKEFCQKFAGAIDHFIQSCSAFIKHGENALDVVFDRLCDEAKRHTLRAVDAYAILESKGWDINPLYQMVRYSGSANDFELVETYSLIMENWNRTETYPIQQSKICVICSD